MKKTFLVVLLLTWTCTIYAQINLVKNPSFEEYTSCPNYYNQIARAKYWNPIDVVDSFPYCSPEYCNKCVSGVQGSGVPNGLGYYYHYARTGNAMAHTIMFSDESFSTPYIRDYTQGHFTTNLVAGKSYCVAFYVSLTSLSTYAINNLGAYFDDGTIDTAGFNTCGSVQSQFTPQVHETAIINNNVNDSVGGWTKVEGTFTANGTETCITIGNFFTKAQTQHIQIQSAGSASFYLIDDVSVIPSDNLPNAGNDTTINAGDTAFIGPHEVALPYTWYKYASATPIDSGGGIAVHPDTTTTYVLQQTLCGATTYDTVTVSVVPHTNGVNAILMANVLVYPNPAKDVVHVDNAMGAVVSVYDVVGKVIKEEVVSSDRMQLPIKELANGVYFVEIRSEGGARKVVRLVKE